jgi:hypothetical protein
MRTTIIVLAAAMNLAAQSASVSETPSKQPITAVEEGPKASARERAATAITAGVTVPFFLPAVSVRTLFTGDYSHSIVIPSGATRVTFELRTLTPNVDVDLYVRRGSEPTLPAGGGQVIADYSSIGLTGNEDIVIQSPPAGTYYAAYGMYSLFASANCTIRVIIELPAPCTYSLSGSSTTIPGAGGTGSFQVLAPAGCAWTATSPAPWITVTSGSSGSGNGTVSFSVAPNLTGSLRFAVFIVGGQSYRVEQPPLPACTYSISPIDLFMPASGGNATVTVTAPAGCNWSVAPGASWVFLSGASSGSGNGGVPLSISPNTGTLQRSTTLTIAGIPFVITQEGASCTYTLTPPSTFVPASGASLQINVTASTGCAWTAASNAAWITVTTGSSGSGPGSISFVVAPNNTPSSRTGTLTVGGQTFTITQAGGGCSFQLSPAFAEFSSAGGIGSFMVTTGDSCSWNLTNSLTWISILSGASGFGPGMVTYNVSPNPNAGSRAGTLSISGQQFTVTQSGTTLPPPSQTQATRFVAVEPCRLVETRPEYNFEGRTGPFGPPFLNGGETRTFTPSASSVCRNIPASARAFVLNVTLVPRGFVDFVTVYPAGETRPDFWTVRSQDGQIVANSAIVRAGSAGGLSIYTSNATDLIIDISGYFTDDSSLSNLVYYPLTPCRVIETRPEYRPAFGPFGPPAMNARETRSFRLPGNGYCPVPAGAAAYSITITVVPTINLAYLTAWPSGRTQPNVSSMNSPTGRVLANSVIVPASPDGSISLFTFDRTDVIVDINGYFAPDDRATGLFYFPTRQCRVSNTLDPSFTGAFGGGMLGSESTRTIPILASPNCPGIASNARAYAANATVIPNGSPMPFLTVWPTGQARPNASVINAFQGQTVSSGFIVPAGLGGSIDVFAYRATHLAMELAGYFGR